MSNSSRSSKLDRNREKVIQDRLQALITKMLQDEDNKYCVDCDSKGPRWASWNLGIFLCIRCAGIHRNLGVHISKVKSVNLDSWTPVQVSSMQVMGNSRGRAVYEARISEDFRRPQTDQQMDTLIRTKYEKKKYIALEWQPTKPPDFPQGWAELIEAEKQKKDIRSVVLPSRALNLSNNSPSKASSSTSNVPEKAKGENGNGTSSNKVSANVQMPTTTKSPAAFDLLGLDTANNLSTSNNLVISKDSTQSVAQKLPTPLCADGVPTKLSAQLDLLCIGEGTIKSTNDNDFDDFVGASLKPNVGTSNGSTSSLPGQTSHQSSNSSDLEQLASGFSSSCQTVNENGKSGSMSKDSIMALFNKPLSTPTATHNAMHMSGAGQPATASYPFGVQGLQGSVHGTTFNMSAQSPGMVCGVPTIQNNMVAVGGGSTFQQQAPVLNHFGIQQPPAAISTSNNPFLTNIAAAGNAASTSNSTQSGWGFFN